MRRLVALLAAAAFSAHAQDYPSKPVRLIVPLAAGGIADNLARTLGQKISDLAKQPVIVDNRPGAASVIGTELAAKAPADGYTLLLGGPGALTVLPLLRKDLPFDAAKDFAPIINVVVFANLLVVHPSVPAKSLKELIALAKANPGKLSFASQGIASSGHMVGEQFKQVAGIDIVHVPYKGAAPAVQDLVGGQVSMMFAPLQTALPFIKSGKLRALGIASQKRSPLLPDVPTIAEQGVAKFEAVSWYALMVPAATPSDVVDRLSAATVRFLASPDARARLAAQGMDPGGGTPQELAATIRAESARWSEVVRKQNIKPE